MSQARDIENEKVLCVLKCVLVEHGGRLWALERDHHMVMRLGDDEELHLRSRQAEVAPAPAPMIALLEKLPSASARAAVRRMPDGDYEIGGVGVLSKYLDPVLLLHSKAEWRATRWWDPVYAVVDGAVVAMVMGVSPLEGEAPS